MLETVYFPDGLIKDMFETFRSRLLELAETDVNWTKVSELELPSWQLERIAGINSTEKRYLLKCCMTSSWNRLRSNLQKQQ